MFPDRTGSAPPEAQPEEPEGLDKTDTATGWDDYPLDSVFVRTQLRTVTEVVRRINEGRYDLNPDFQRDFVWTDEKQSRLIESCLMRIPLPVFYVAEAKDGRIIVVDGLQRLSTFRRYLNGGFALTFPNERCLSVPGKARTLRGQVNAWIGEFFPGAEADAQRVPDTSLVRLLFRTGQSQDFHRPSNVGYGLTYAFPLLVAGLCASPGQLLVVDSPEAHLHPRAQARMGQFLVQVASSGPQLIVETHSDHVLNGIRLAIRDGVVAPDDVAIHFFNSPTADDTGIPGS